uniref:NADH-ubiquinone oxidoreductase chain 2 n=1 Tax=Symphylella sp. YG-2006 TaxID=390856 RepID=B7S775_9MYRI|nr:NADH dehydrogenase subunit 2 [Symphylella sp. YG-2006]ABQ01744.1 NADH dehydrogenase subunit 2 [Symphylella sp. YG-2006]
MNPTTILSLTMNLLSIIILMTSSSWITMWMAFELNMVSFIPMMMNKQNNSTPESMMKYFMIQTIGSIMLILAMIMKNTPMTTPNMTSLITLSMLTKMGAFPVFQWLPSVTEGLSWMTMTLLLTTQKIMPMFLMMMMNNLTMIYLAAAASALVGAIGGFNQIMTRKMMAYSSITHMGWMLMIINNKMLVMIYIFLYSIILLSITMQMKEMSMYSISTSYQKTTKKTLIMSMLSLGGMPPLLGFMPKLLSINWITKNNFLMLIPLIIGALINLSFYMNIMMKSMLMNTTTTSLKKNNKMSLQAMSIPSATLTAPVMMM